MKKPKLIGRMVYEGDIGECPLCKSSLRRKFIFFKTKKCIHPKCDNYFKKENHFSEAFVINPKNFFPHELIEKVNKGLIKLDQIPEPEYFYVAKHIDNKITEKEIAWKIAMQK